MLKKHPDLGMAQVLLKHGQGFLLLVPCSQAGPDHCQNHKAIGFGLARSVPAIIAGDPPVVSQFPMIKIALS